MLLGDCCRWALISDCQHGARGDDLLEVGAAQTDTRDQNARRMGIWCPISFPPLHPPHPAPPRGHYPAHTFTCTDILGLQAVTGSRFAGKIGKMPGRGCAPDSVTAARYGFLPPAPISPTPARFLGALTPRDWARILWWTHQGARRGGWQLKCCADTSCR